MGTMLKDKIGLAGEFRVMAELLLKGHNPAKSYLEQGADIVLENGLRIEVKSGHRCHSNISGKYHTTRNNYSFVLKRAQARSLETCDFLILWCMDDDCFFIIPVGVITGTCIGIATISPKFKYFSYKDKWELLEVKE